MSTLYVGDYVYRAAEPNKFFPLGCILKVESVRISPVDSSPQVRVSYTYLALRPRGVTVVEGLGMESQWWGAVNFVRGSQMPEVENEPL